jgi:hypothetical protein
VLDAHDQYLEPQSSWFRRDHGRVDPGGAGGMAQRALAAAACLSLPTIQRMEASEGVVHG